MFWFDNKSRNLCTKRNFLYHATSAQNATFYHATSRLKTFILKCKHSLVLLMIALKFCKKIVLKKSMNDLLLNSFRAHPPCLKSEIQRQWFGLSRLENDFITRYNDGLRLNDRKISCFTCTKYKENAENTQCSSVHVVECQTMRNESRTLSVVVVKLRSKSAPRGPISS